MSFTTVNAEALQKLLKSHPKNASFDWFAIGFIFAHANNTKTLEEIFSSVNNVTSLSRDNALSVQDTTEIIVRMMNNLGVAERKSTSSNGAGSDGKKGVPIRKSSTIEMEEDLSYKSDQDGSPSKSKKEGGNKRLTEDSNSRTFEYVRKAIKDVDVSDLAVEKNLKRLPTHDEEALSLELIRKMQQEEEEMNKQIETRKKQEEQEQENILCSICLGSLMDEGFIPLSNCEHMFHENCFAEYLKSEIHSRHFPIRCPSNCGKEVDQTDMGQVLDKDLVTKFYDYSIQKYVSMHADEISCCPTPNCTYAWVQDENAGDENVLKCPSCKKKYCLNCRVDFHKGQTCKEYQVTNRRDANDIKFEKFVKGKKYKQCSKCKFWVEKNQGCDHMTCRCKYEFCYKCGGKYRECECVKRMQEAAQKAQERRQKAMANRKKRK